MEECRARGIRLTPQRLAIFEALTHRAGHLSAEDIYHHVLPSYPTLSFATVYNTLQLLVRMGQVRESIVDDLRRRYDVNTEPHHHAVCRSRQKITDVSPSDAGLEKVSAANLSGYGFQIESVSIELTGLCADCAAA